METGGIELALPLALVRPYVRTPCTDRFHVKHTALASMINVTFVNYTGAWPFRGAIESCGKCKNFQGGATTFTANLTFLQPGLPYMSQWSWGHQVRLGLLFAVVLLFVGVPAPPSQVERRAVQAHMYGCSSPLFAPTLPQCLPLAMPLTGYHLCPFTCTQGIFQDLDGSLINSKTMPANLLQLAGYSTTSGVGQAGTTWHSAVESTLFQV